jgi:hypothetical protein
MEKKLAKVVPEQEKEEDKAEEKVKKLNHDLEEEKKGREIEYDPEDSMCTVVLKKCVKRNHHKVLAGNFVFFLITFILLLYAYGWIHF